MALSFQRMIFTLQNYWSDHGCAIVSPYDMEMGAGTSHPATLLYAVSPKPWKFAYIQPSRRPQDGRYGENPNRVYRHHQMQVIMKPSPDNIQDLYLGSLAAIGIDPHVHDIRFVEDDWENPTLGASGLGWEVWCNGMEISQFTYFQQVGGIECSPVTGELAYGLERIAMYLQDVDDIFDLTWNNPKNPEDQLYYRDFFKDFEREWSLYALDEADTDLLYKQFVQYEQECRRMLEKTLPVAAYELVLKCCHTFNLLDSRGVIAQTERAAYIARIRNLVREACQHIADRGAAESLEDHLSQMEA